MEAISVCSAVITYIRRSSARRSSKPWVNWRAMVSEFYEQFMDRSEINLHINEGVRYAKNIHSVEEMTELIRSKSKEKVEILRMLDSFFILVKRHNEFLAEKLFRTKWEKLLEDLDVTKEERELMESTSLDVVEKFEDKNFHIQVTTGASLWLLLIDFFVRWGLLALYQTDQLYVINNYTLGFENIIGFFFVVQIFFIPFVLILAGIFRNRYVAQKLRKFTQQLGLWNIRFEVKHNAWEYSLIVFFMLTGIYITYSLMPGTELDKIVVATLSGVFYLAYLMVILRLFSKKVPSIDGLNNELKKQETSGIAKELDPDENDEEIVNLEVKLRSVNERMNAYVLEATLFGALAFSGFLQIVASEVFSIDDIKVFTLQLFAFLDGIIAFNLGHYQDFLSVLNSREGLLALICYETLFCSIFFLSVIASRLRFSDLTDTIDKALQLSRSYNVKEEDLLSQDRSVDDARVMKFNRQIREVLKVGNLNQKKIAPIMEYMAFFRNLGVISFFIIIITAGLFISVELALIFCLILLLSFLYFKFDNIIFYFRSLSLKIEEFYYNYHNKVNRIAWSIILVSSIFRSLGWAVGELFLLVGFLSLIIHNLLRLFVPEFEEGLTDMEEKGSNLSPSLDRIFKIALSVFFLGWYFNIQHFPGAEAVFTVAGAAFSIYFLFRSLNPSAPKGLRLMTNFSLGLAPIPLIFLVNDIVWSELLLMIVIPLLGIVIFNSFTHKTYFRPFIRNSAILFLLLFSVHYFDYSSYAFQTLRVDPRGYEEFYTMNLLRDKIDRYDEPQTRSEYDSLLTYKIKYSFASIGQKSAADINQEAESYFVYGAQDERFLMVADRLLTMSMERKKFYHNYVNRLEVLIDLERFAEAKPLAEEFLEHALLFENRTKQDVARHYLDRVNGMLASSKMITASG